MAQTACMRSPPAKSRISRKGAEPRAPPQECRCDCGHDSPDLPAELVAHFAAADTGRLQWVPGTQLIGSMTQDISVAARQPGTPVLESTVSGSSGLVAEVPIHRTCQAVSLDDLPGQQSRYAKREFPNALDERKGECLLGGQADDRTEQNEATLLHAKGTGHEERRAADRLNVTQSTISARIRVLEDELGTPLFTRNKAGVTLTPAGAQFERHALALVRIWQQARQEVSLPSDQRQLPL